MASIFAAWFLSMRIRFVPDAKGFYRERDSDRLSFVQSDQKERIRIFFRCSCMFSIFAHLKTAKELERMPEVFADVVRLHF